EGERESNRVGPSRPGDEGQHTQNGSPPRVVSRNLKTKTPNRSRLGVEWWWSQGGSNSRPRHCERRALPAELWPHGDGDVRARILARPLRFAKPPRAGNRRCVQSAVAARLRLRLRAGAAAFSAGRAGGGSTWPIQARVSRWARKWRRYCGDSCPIRFSARCTSLPELSGPASSGRSCSERRSWLSLRTCAHNRRSSPSTAISCTSPEA